MMTSVDVTRDALDAAERATPPGVPIRMVNLVRYRDQADYGGSSEFPPCTGREAYLVRYRAAFGEVMAGEDVKLIFAGDVRALPVASPGEQWDAVAVVEYPSFAVLRRMFDNPAYEEKAAPHRRAALADWRFIVTTAMG